MKIESAPSPFPFNFYETTRYRLLRRPVLIFVIAGYCPSSFPLSLLLSKAPAPLAELYYFVELEAIVAPFIHFRLDRFHAVRAVLARAVIRKEGHFTPSLFAFRLAKVYVGLRRLGSVLCC